MRAGCTLADRIGGVRFRLDDVALATGGRVLVAPADDATADGVTVDGVSVDSRSVRAGELFVPLVAERDGHDFLPAAASAGAAAVLTTDPDRVPAGVGAVLVADTGAALSALGTAARDRLTDRVIGITGSVGKTSVKDLLAAVLGRVAVTTASARSFNNEIGVPLTLANAREDTEVLVQEMGARGVGHIAALCAVARPTTAVVTMVAEVHTSEFADLDTVARAKRELVEAVPADGTVVLNAADPRVAAMAEVTDARVLTFGGPTGEVVAVDVALDDDLCPSFVLRTPVGEVPVRLSIHGAHQVDNALAAAATALAHGVGLADIAAGLAEAELSPWRMERHRTSSGAVVLNDAYNANPTSVRAALDALTAAPGHRRVAVLGVMAELGEVSEARHREVAAYAAERGIEVIAVGDAPYGPDVIGAVADADSARRVLGVLGEGDVVLVKASRSAGLESLARRLAEA